MSIFQNPNHVINLWLDQTLSIYLYITECKISITNFELVINDDSLIDHIKLL